MSKLQIRSIYNKALEGAEYDQYIKKQVHIHNIKADRKRPYSEYEICAAKMVDHAKANGKMLCIGTRNEYEKESFKILLASKNVNVFSQDLAVLAKSDYTCDFNELSKHVPHDWDVLYSNCLDHAINADKAVEDWLKILNPNGILVLGFCFLPAANKDDVCVFSPDSINAFIEEHEVLQKINDYDSGHWHYWTMRKKV